jgi:ribonuclease HI
MKTVQLITDGACIRNPGPGGWACILRYKKIKREMWGSDPETTNNRMEIMAAVQGLAALNEPCDVEIVTDSQYLMNGITKWMKGWKRNGWLTKEQNPVLNRDLWERLDELNAKHSTHWTWTKGHSSHADNNRCDELATRAAAAQSFSK